MHLVLAKVCTIVYLLEGLLEDVPPEKKNSDLMEQFFVFALMWAFGGPMVVDKSDDYRRWGSYAVVTTQKHKETSTIVAFAAAPALSFSGKCAKATARYTFLFPYCCLGFVVPKTCQTLCCRRKFSEEFLSTFAGQKIPKEGTCFDYFYDWQSDGFKDWSTQVCYS